MSTMIQRAVLPAYALLAYAAFLVSLVWAVGFLANAGWSPTTVDGGPSPHGPGSALLVDLALLTLFALQHTVMARATVKSLLRRVQHRAAERSTYVLAASVSLFLLLGLWEPLPTTVWQVGTPWSAGVWGVYGVGWFVVVTATFMVDHADFLGLRQAFREARGLPYEPPEFTERALYAWCRHPMMLGLVIVFWATPWMTVGHLVFAVAATGYIAVGIRFEERDLRAQLGPTYDNYARRVPALVPWNLRTSRGGRRSHVT